jgi:hypothetical protein
VLTGQSGKGVQQSLHSAAQLAQGFLISQMLKRAWPLFNKKALHKSARL